MIIAERGETDLRFKLYGVDRVILILFLVCVTVGVTIVAVDKRVNRYFTYETTATMVGYASDRKSPVWSYDVNGETIVNYPGASGEGETVSYGGMLFRPGDQAAIHVDPSNPYRYSMDSFPLFIGSIILWAVALVLIPIGITYHKRQKRYEDAMGGDDLHLTSFEHAKVIVRGLGMPFVIRIKRRK